VPHAVYVEHTQHAEGKNARAEERIWLVNLLGPLQNSEKANIKFVMSLF